MDAEKKTWIGALLILAYMAIVVGVILLAMGVGGTAQAEPEPSFPDNGMPWATINAWDVCFREGPGTEYPVRQHWSLGAAIEVMGEQDGWVQVRRWTSPVPLWVWGEYLDMVVDF